MDFKIYKLPDIDFNKIIYSEPIMSKNITHIYTSYNDNNQGNIPLLFQVPSLYSPDSTVPIQSDNVSHELLLPLVCKNQKTTNQVTKFFNGLDKKFMKDIKKNKKRWNIFDHKLNYEIIVKPVESNDYIFRNDAIKLKFIKTDSFQTKVYDGKKQLISHRNYKKIFDGNCYVKIIMECVSIWYKDNKIGINLRTHQVKVTKKHPPVTILSEYSFADSEKKDSSEEFFPKNNRKKQMRYYIKEDKFGYN